MYTFHYQKRNRIFQFNSRFQLQSTDKQNIYQRIQKRKHSKFLVYLLKTYLDNNKYFFLLLYLVSKIIFYKFISHVCRFLYFCIREKEYFYLKKNVQYSLYVN